MGWQWAEQGEQVDEEVLTAEPDRWPQLPDDSPLWTTPLPAFSTDHLRRLDHEQRGW